MGTAEGNRLRPEEHTTGAPVVMRAAVHKSFSALEAEVGGVADPRDQGPSGLARSVQINRRATVNHAGAC